MFGQLLPNKNKIATVGHDVYYAKFASKVWYLNMALYSYKTKPNEMFSLSPSCHFPPRDNHWLSNPFKQTIHVIP
jgi:hypothetical protein